MQAVKCKQPLSGEALQTIWGTVAASEDSSEEAQVERVLYLQAQFVVMQWEVSLLDKYSSEDSWYSLV